MISSLINKNVSSSHAKHYVLDCSAPPRVRSDGQSGVKAVRLSTTGTQNYYSASHLSNRYLSVHDHANYDRTGQ